MNREPQQSSRENHGAGRDHYLAHYRDRIAQAAHGQTRARPSGKATIHFHYVVKALGAQKFHRAGGSQAGLAAEHNKPVPGNFGLAAFNRFEGQALRAWHVPGTKFILGANIDQADASLLAIKFFFYGAWCELLHAILFRQKELFRSGRDESSILRPVHRRAP